jgi:hypothetical protein
MKMFKINRFKISTVFIIFTLCFNLLQVKPVLADEGTPTEPPPPSEVTAAPAIEPPADATEPAGDATDVPVVEPPAQATEPAGDATDVPVVEPPTEATDPAVAATDVPAVEPPAQATTASVATDAPVIAPPAQAAEPVGDASNPDTNGEKKPAREPVTQPIVSVEPVTSAENSTDSTVTPIAESMAALPENVPLVVLNTVGEPLALASQEAANIIQEVDPMWCPDGTLPGAGTCKSFNTVALLQTDINNNANSYAQNGIIYFTSTAGTATSSFSLTNTSIGTGDFNTIKPYNLTLQGGWNGSSGTLATFLGQTTFENNSSVTIGSTGYGGNAWGGNITLNNFTFSGVTSSNAVTIYTAGNIALNNVTANGSTNNNVGAYLNNSSGTGSVTVTGSTFNQNRNGLIVTSKGLITLVNVTASSNRGDGAQLNNNQGTSTSNIDIVKSTFSSNTGNGLTANSNGNIRLINVTAQNNGGDGVNLNFPTAGTHTVTICGGTYNGQSGSGDYNVQVNNGDTLYTNLTINGWSNWSPGSGSWLGGTTRCNTYTDTDNDQVPDQWDTDDDNDGVPDASDAFPLNPNESVDTDHDGIGNNTDTDDDNDGVPDASDAFPLNPNESVDTDHDGIGNNTDTDDDNDGVPDASDAFPLNPNESVDTDHDGIGNNTDTDDDNDGVADASDTCPVGASTGTDTDGDGCKDTTEDNDNDNDGVANATDPCPTDATNACAAGDTDSDGITNATDNCPSVSNADQANADGDALGNACDPDDDNDGVSDATDPCPTDAANACPAGDTDGDNVTNADDLCAETPEGEIANDDGCSPSQLDTDEDQVSDADDDCPDVAGPASNNGCPVQSTTTIGGGGGKGDDPTDPNAGNPSLPAVQGLIPVTGGALTTTLSCTSEPTTIAQAGFQVAFTSLCGYSAFVDETFQIGAPGTLPDNQTFVSGISVTVLSSGNPITILPTSSYFTLSFGIPTGMTGDTLVVLYWDPAGNNGIGAWVEKSGTVVDGQLVVTNLNAPGTFVIVNKSAIAQTDIHPLGGGNGFYTVVMDWLDKLAWLFGNN